MGYKVITVFKNILNVAFCLLVSQFCFAGAAPLALDFIGGAYVNGEYRCYSEPCFSLHKGKAAASANVRTFEIREWLPRRGDEWACQNAYTDMLEKTSITDVKFFKSQSGCKLIRLGEWRDAYTGELIDGMKNIAVDQRISLKEAHLYGGAFWSRERRMAFAYHPLNLMPVSSAQKSLRDGRSASEWMPEDKSTWCDYIVYREIVSRNFKLILPLEETLHENKIKKLYCKY
ncbi:MAG: hypothetical protein ACI84K_000451 [Pseudohongiellaceae bacterium]|jgi:hypothetical protein